MAERLQSEPVDLQRFQLTPDVPEGREQTIQCLSVRIASGDRRAETALGALVGELLMVGKKDRLRHG